MKFNERVQSRTKKRSKLEIKRSFLTSYRESPITWLVSFHVKYAFIIDYLSRENRYDSETNNSY